MGGCVIRLLQNLTQYLATVIVPNPIFVNGYKLYWHSSTYVDAIYYAKGKYDEDTDQLFQSLTRSGMVVIDIGASIGYYALLFAKIVGSKGKVYAIEPQPWNCDVIRKSAEANGFENITIIQKAVSNKSGVLDLYFTSKGDGGASLYAEVKLKGCSHIAVESTTLDILFKNEGWPSVDIIKMDIEGSEKAALEGARELFRRNPQIKLIMEFFPRIQQNAGVNAKDLLTILLELGFTRFSIIKNGLHPVIIPHDIPKIIQMVGDDIVNIYCSKS